MKLEQKILSGEKVWNPDSKTDLGKNAQIVFAFGSREMLKRDDCLKEIRELYPEAHIFGCSSAGEIAGTQIVDDTIVATAVQFENTRVRKVSREIVSMEDSKLTGEELAKELKSDDLRHVFVLSDGLKVNGSDLVSGFVETLPEDVTVTGGLSGDGTNFTETVVVGENVAKSGIVSALGFYGDSIRIGYGSKGGWDAYGPYRLITSSKGNVLYEMDGKPAIDLYRQYLGKYADDLLASGLLFPLMLKEKEGREAGVVRTFLSINEDQSMVYAGDVPQGVYARLMKANFDRLIEGAVDAAEISKIQEKFPPTLAVLVSCVGRRKVLNQRTEEELEGVQDILGASTVMTGFYSYGEICPFQPGEASELHNQTMTITTFWET